MSDLIAVVSEGDRAKSLQALRDTLATTIATAEPSNVAALAKQLRDTMTELAGLSDDVEVDALDELAARRPAKAKVRKRPAVNDE